MNRTLQSNQAGLRSFHRYVLFVFVSLLIVSSFTTPVLASDAENALNQPVKSPPRKISGRVLDKDKQPIAGATVLVKGTTLGTSTSANGEFSLDVPAGKQTLEVFFLGMKPEEIPYNGQTSLTVTLQDDVSKMDEVIVVGYGSTKRKDMTGTVAVIGSKEIGMTAPGQTINGMLQGRVAGASVQIQSASPTSPISVVIRGQSSLSGNNQPLWVIDGIPDYSSSTSGNVASTLYNLNLNDVESISILKDASGTAIYGSRAANGVVIVTTKGGQRNMRPQISVSASLGFQTHDYHGSKYMTAGPYRKFMEEAVIFELETMGALDYFTKAYSNEAFLKGFRTSEIDRQLVRFDKNGAGDKIFYEYDTDWQKEVGQTPVFQNYDLSVRGGTENSSYYISMFAKMQTGVIKTGFSDTYGGSANVETKIAKRLKFSMNIDGSYRKTNDRDDMLDLVRRIRPDIRPYNADGSLFRQDYYTKNPFAILQNTDISDGIVLRIMPYLEYEIMDGLRARVTPSIVYQESKGLSHERRSEYADNGEITIDQNSRKWSNEENLTKSFEGTLTYNKVVGKHDILALGGFSMEKFRNMFYSMGASNFPDDDVLNTFPNASSKDSMDETTTENALMSYFARLQYKFNDRYLLSATLRRDGSSRFGANNRWGTFPSVGMGWIMTNEDFMKPIASVLNMMKLRASYGVTGSQNLGDYGYYSSTTGGTYNGAPATYPSTMANPDLRWEKSKMLDVGIDFGMFDDRVRGSIVWYQRRTEDLIYNMSVPTSSSFSNVKANIGTTQNRGIEFEVSVDAIRTPNHLLTFSANIAHGVNRVIQFDGKIEALYFLGSVTAPNARQTYMRIVPGGRLNQWYGYDYHRLFYTAEEARAAEAEDETGNKINYFPVGNNPGILREGDIWRIDQNGDGKVDVNDMVELGSAEPTVYGGFGISYYWKNLSISSSFTYAAGFERFWDPASSGMGSNNYNQTNKIGGNTAFLTGLSEKAMPNVTPYDYPYNSTFNSRFLYDASYLRLSNLNLTYRLPKKVFGKNGMVESLDLTFTATNLFTLTSYPGMDPQGNWSSTTFGTGMGVDYGTYPAARTYTFGVRFTFK